MFIFINMSSFLLLSFPSSFLTVLLFLLLYSIRSESVIIVGNCKVECVVCSRGLSANPFRSRSSSCVVRSLFLHGKDC